VNETRPVRSQVEFYLVSAGKPGRRRVGSRSATSVRGYPPPTGETETPRIEQLRAELIQILSISLGLDMLPKIRQMRDNRGFGCSAIHVIDSINYLLVLPDGLSPDLWRKIEVTYRFGLAM
jgi:hypothetical protein